MAEEWWRGAVIYQIYPRSYLDTTGNGIGDLQGITDKLDYVASLGVEGIWISPFFQSPMKDFGYDISDYRAVDPMFGDIEDFKVLLEKAHSLNLKIIIDMVLNHTSDKHPWFQDSRQNPQGDKADWYVWANPKPDGTPPNNWVSVFGGPAWTFDSWRGQYYMHQFLKEQPDLNYNNPKVVEAILEECRFWLDLGVDGFRLDAINHCTCDPELKDNPPKDGGFSAQLEFPDPYSMQQHKYDKSQPQNLDFMRKIRKLLDEYPNTFALAEIGDDDPVRLSAEYTYGPDLLHTAYSFAMMGHNGTLPKSSFFRNMLQEQIAAGKDSWPAWAFSNHDVVRAASRWCDGRFGHNPELSKMLIALLGCLRGTAFLYQGEELGLPDAQIPYERLQDPWGKTLYPKWQGRDGARTPMPWDGTKSMAGFSEADDTWLPIPQDHLPLSVEKQENDDNSTLHFTRDFLNWRKIQPLLRAGEIEFLDNLPDHILGFKRINDDQEMTFIFNLSETPTTLTLTDLPQQNVTNSPFKGLSEVEGNKLHVKAYGVSILD